MLRSLLNDWNYFWNKYYNLPFLVVCRSQSFLLIFLASSWNQKAKTAPRTSLRNKNNNVNKKTCWTKNIINNIITKPSSTFLNFSVLTDCCMSVFPLFLKVFANFEKLIKFHRQTFIIYENGENLKILKEIFRQKLIASNVILTFKTIWNFEFLWQQVMVDIERPPFSKSLDPPLNCILEDLEISWRILELVN